MTFIEGAMEPMIEPLMAYDLEQKLAAVNN